MFWLPTCPSVESNDADQYRVRVFHLSSHQYLDFYRKINAALSKKIVPNLDLRDCPPCLSVMWGGFSVAAPHLNMSAGTPFSRMARRIRRPWGRSRRRTPSARRRHPAWLSDPARTGPCGERANQMMEIIALMLFTANSQSPTNAYECGHWIELNNSPKNH